MESELINWLRRRVPSAERLLVGIGDDAAVLRVGDDDCVVTTDMMMDGVDFILSEVEATQVGHKALAINLSDLAAMAAQPIAAVVALALPRAGGLSLAKQLYEGMLPLADDYGVAIAGGDTNSWDGPLVVSVTALGTCGGRAPLGRCGACPGDWIMVTGRLGGSLLGRHLNVAPRVRQVLTLRESYELRAAIDISDGLALDLSRMCDESRCGAEVMLDSIPIHPDARQMADACEDGASALEHALGDGEDFEILFAASSEDGKRMLAGNPLEVPLSHIGTFISQRGIWALDGHGQRAPLPARGYQHELGE